MVSLRMQLSVKRRARGQTLKMSIIRLTSSIDQYIVTNAIKDEIVNSELCHQAKRTVSVLAIHSPEGL